jgi:hypothetical protein
MRDRDAARVAAGRSGRVLLAVSKFGIFGVNGLENGSDGCIQGLGAPVQRVNATALHETMNGSAFPAPERGNAAATGRETAESGVVA